LVCRLGYPSSQQYTPLPFLATTLRSTRLLRALSAAFSTLSGVSCPAQLIRGRLAGCRRR
jgi:hypothetical protein